MTSELVTPGLVEPQGRGEDPLYYFTRVILLFLQGLFEQFPEGSYRWSDDQTISEICITNETPIPRDRVEQRPAIVTLRGQAQFGNLSLDNMRSLNMRTGMKERTDLVACTITAACIAKLPIEAQRIAWIVATNVRNFKEILQRAGIHKIGDEVGMGPPTPAGSMIQGESDLEYTMIPVQIPFFFQWTVKVSPLNAPVLRSIEAKLRTALPDPAETSTQGALETRLRIGTPTIRGKVINTEPAYGNSDPIKQTSKT